jgi:hypothetical protein
MDCMPKKKKKKKKKTVKEKIEHEETLQNINAHILPTKAKTVTCHKTDSSSRPGV